MDRTAAQLQQFLGHPLGDRRVLRLLTKAPEQRYYDQRRPDAGFMGHDMKHFRYLLTALLLSATAQAGSLEWPQLAGPHRDFTSDAREFARGSWGFRPEILALSERFLWKHRACELWITASASRRSDDRQLRFEPQKSTGRGL